MKTALGIVLVLLFAGCGPAGKAGQPAGLETTPEHPFIVAENVLEERLLAFVHRPDPATEKALLEALLNSVVYVKVGEEAIDSDGKVKSAPSIRVWTVTTADGSNAVALYTSKKRLREAFPKDQRLSYVGYSGLEALRIAVNQPVALNWGVDPHVLIPTETVKRLQASSDTALH